MVPATMENTCLFVLPVAAMNNKLVLVHASSQHDGVGGVRGGQSRGSPTYVTRLCRRLLCNVTEKMP